MTITWSDLWPYLTIWGEAASLAWGTMFGLWIGSYVLRAIRAWMHGRL